MGIFDGFGGGGFQGPGEEFGNAWDSFQTGRGNYMTGPDGSKSNGIGQWSGGNYVSGPMQHSPLPIRRPTDLTQAGSPSLAGQQGNFLQSILGQIPLIKILSEVMKKGGGGAV